MGPEGWDQRGGSRGVLAEGWDQRGGTRGVVAEGC